VPLSVPTRYTTRQHDSYGMTSNNCSRIQGAANKGNNLLDKTNRNELKQRKFFVDKDVASIFGESAAGSLTSEEKRILNFIVEHGSINVSECLRLLPTLPKWHAAKRLLESMRIRAIYFTSTASMFFATRTLDMYWRSDQMRVLIKVRFNI